jgi:hypothetical protein
MILHQESSFSVFLAMDVPQWILPGARKNWEEIPFYTDMVLKNYPFKVP